MEVRYDNIRVSYLMPGSVATEFGREVATGKEARKICKIGVFYDTVEETLAANGFAPNAKGRQQGFLRKAA